MIEKRVFLAAILSTMFFAWYAHGIQKRSQAAQSEHSLETPNPYAAQAVSPAPAQVEAPDVVDTPDALEPVQAVWRAPEDEPGIVLASPSLSVTVGSQSGAIRDVVLKNFTDTATQAPLILKGQHPLTSLHFSKDSNTWELVKQDNQSALFHVSDQNGRSYEVYYQLSLELPVINIKIKPFYEILSSNEEYLWVQQNFYPSSQHAGGRNQLQAVAWIEKSPQSAQRKHKTFTAPFKKKQNVPRGTFLTTLTENYFCQAFDPKGVATELILVPSEEPHSITTRAGLLLNASSLTGKQFEARLYFGPRDFFYLRKAGFNNALKVGMLGQIGLMLLALLSALARLTHNYGVAIILFSATISALLAPFTLLSYRSMQKLQKLQPEMNKIMEKHKDNPTKANQEVFALYKQEKVSPLSGCLPMLLQWPILIALFQAISHYIELRGQGFLWIQDLSMPDRFAALPFALPILGSDFNLLPLIMAAAMYVQTRLNQSGAQAASTNAAAKMMSGPMMPVIFCFMLYNFPSGLVLYWLMNSIFSAAMYQLTKK